VKALPAVLEAAQARGLALGTVTQLLAVEAARRGEAPPTSG
jgi:hypothetical protein